MENNSLNEVFKYLRLIYKRRYLFLLVSLLVMSAGIGAAYLKPKQYKGDSTVFIEENVIKNLVKGLAVTPDMSDRIRVLRYALLSRDLIQKTINDLDIDLGIKNEAQRQEFITKLQQRTDIKIKNSDLFIVSITDQNPVFAQKYINTLISKYVEENISAKREETYGANRFLDEQLVLFKTKLDNAENAIIEFRKKQGIFSAVDEGTLLADIKTYEKSIEELNLSLGTLVARKKRLESQKAGTDPTIALFSERQKDNRVALLHARIGQLLVTYTEDYPEVVKLKAEIDALKSRGESGDDPAESTTTAVNPLYQEIQQKIYETEAEMAALTARRDRLQELRAEKELELQNVPETRKKLAVLTQERDSYKKIHEELLMRMGQSEVSKQMEIGDKTTTFRVVDPAVFPREPVSPNMIKMIVLAIAAGLGAGAGLVLLLENMNPSIKDFHQLEEFGIDVLAVIPTIVDPARQKRQRRRDALAFLMAGLYFSGVLGLLGFEFLKKMGKI